MVSSGVVALFVAVAVQAAQGYVIDTSCGCAPPVVPACAAPVVPACAPAVEVGCCPGPVIEKKTVTTKAINVPYSYSVPTYSKQCYTQSAGVDRKVIPSTFQTAPVCETSQTIVKVPTTEVEVKQQPLCKRTCTTSEYLIQIPIVETTCTNSPLCKKTVKTQNNLFTTCARKTACAKQVCTQNQVVETPLTRTVCQDYQGSITKVGSQTILKPEVRKSCVQLPPYKCLKPASPDAVTVTPYGAGAYADGVAYASGLPYGPVVDGVYGGVYANGGVYGPVAVDGVYDGVYANGGVYGPAYAGAYPDVAYSSGTAVAVDGVVPAVYSSPAYIPGPACGCGC